MTLRRTAAATVVSALLFAGLTAPTAGASETSVTDGTCTVSASAREYENFVSAAGVFAANWAREIIRDTPAVSADMSTARAWYADKTSEEVDSRPEEVRAAEERIDAAGVRAGYREGETLAPLQLLILRNDRRTHGSVSWFDSHRMTTSEARTRLADARSSGQPAILASTRTDLSVPADEAWNRAWEATPQIQAQHDAALAELELCAEGTPGEVNRTTGNVSVSEAPTPAPTVSGGLAGIVSGLYAAVVQLLSRHIPELRALFTG
ncbi:hypothetical protein [Corynebacterium halotolerans]|uniref:Secreted protein n=1 Tax=Corynebacterium halotolerans YIM 70093 = DSM 44683 TaxID=1121362 RepID=M1NLC2_9CORY|nr:hypothetical protein [Corynebacterium halotolerans]AGF72208.1 hypothetical protein A605_06010 [Corynebacterium halotolerans YIM 70093 = DSM 44683]